MASKAISELFSDVILAKFCQNCKTQYTCISPTFQATQLYRIHGLAPDSILYKMQSTSLQYCYQLSFHWYSPCVVRLAVLVPTRAPLTLTKQVYSPSSSKPTLRIVKVGVVTPDTRSTSSKGLSTRDPRSVLLHRYEMAGDPSALQLKVTLSPVVTVWSGMLSITEEK